MAQLCTYIYRVHSELVNAEATPEQIQSFLETTLGIEHEIISVESMNINATRTDNSNSSITNLIIKIKTQDPEYVAIKLMGNSWVREDHILFKATSLWLPNNNSS